MPGRLRLVDIMVNALDEKIQQRIDRAIRERESERRRAIRQHNELIETDRANQFEFALKESQRYAELLRLKEYLLVVEDAVARMPEHHQRTGTDWVDLVRSRIADKDPVQKRLKGFKSLIKNGSEKSGQYWNEMSLPEA